MTQPDPTPSKTTQPSPHQIEIRNLHASVGDLPILNGINLVVPKGELHAIMGPNGNGKSTLAKVIVGDPEYTVTGRNPAGWRKHPGDGTRRAGPHRPVPGVPVPCGDSRCDHRQLPASGHAGPQR